MMHRFGIRFATVMSLSVLAAVLVVPSVAVAAVSVTRAELSAGSLRVEGQGARASATITVSSPQSTATSRADSKGQFKVSASGLCPSRSPGRRSCCLR